jgi:hypothetical protein
VQLTASATYTGGRGPLGSEAAYGPPTVIIMLAPVDASARLTSIVTAPWTRNEQGALAGVKSTSYAEIIRGLGYAANHDASEAIFLNTAGQICEGTGTNVFMVFGDTVVTPPLSAGPLAGITRELIMEWSTVEQGDLTLRGQTCGRSLHNLVNARRPGCGALGRADLQPGASSYASGCSQLRRAIRSRSRSIMADRVPWCAGAQGR